MRSFERPHTGEHGVKVGRMGEREREERRPCRSIAAVIANVSGRKRNRHARCRAAGHCDSHEKNEYVSHRSIQRRALHQVPERTRAAT